MNIKKLSEVCNILNSTYDTNILNTLDNKIQNLFKRVVKKYKDTNTGNTVLMDLIYNHYYKIKPKVDMLTGPYTLTVHKSNKYNKYIYIFGELHGNENGCDCKIEQKCPIITDYLLELFSTTDVFIDFYLEINPDNCIYTYTDTYINTMYINNMINKFQHCIRPITRKDKKECRLSRMHHIDIRHRNSNNIDVLLKFFKLYNRTYFFEEYPDKTQKDYENMKKTIFTDEKIRNNTIEVLKNFVDIEKMINYIALNISKKGYKSSLYNSIVDFFKTKIKGYIEPNFSEIKEYSENILKVLENKEINTDDNDMLYIYIFDLYYLIYLIDIFFMDCYTLTRIFREFDVKQNVYQPVEPTNIIIYAGNDHSDTYREFLNIMGFDLLESNNKPMGKIKVRCLDMKNIKQPFFKDTR